MKILITLDFPPEHGGIQRYLYDIVKNLYSKSDTVLIGCLKENKGKVLSLSATIKRVSFPFSGINKKLSIISLLPAFIKLCLSFRKNIKVECGNLYAALVPWILFPFLRQQYNIYTYGTELVNLSDRSLKNYLLLSVLKKAQSIYVLGKYTDRIVKQLNLKVKTHFIPPRIDLPLPCGKTEKCGSVRILNVARLEKHKGQSCLIDSLSRLNRLIDFKCIIVGSGPEYPALKARIKKLSLEDRCEIKMNLSDQELHNEFCVSDVFVFPSLTASTGVEGFGIALLEAMAYKLPIIASNSGGIPDVLDSGRCGLLVPERDSQSITGNILRICDDTEFTKQMVSRAYKHLIENYVWE